MKIYLASSWRNPEQPAAVAALRAAGHDVYDFRNPPGGIPNGFRWSELDPNWQNWSADEYRRALQSPLAQQGFNSDFTGMKWADACVLLLPCGRSAHLELGWMAGAGKRTIVWTRDGEEPELMALLADEICTSLAEVQAALLRYSTTDAYIKRALERELSEGVEIDWQDIDNAYSEALEEPCLCDTAEYGCPRCVAWEQARQLLMKALHSKHANLPEQPSAEDCGSDASTPETDAAMIHAVLLHHKGDKYLDAVPVEVARKLERDRNTLQRRLDLILVGKTISANMTSEQLAERLKALKDGEK